MREYPRHPTLDPDDDHSERDSLEEAWRFQDDMEQCLFGEGGLLDPSPPVLPMLKKWTGSPCFHLNANAKTNTNKDDVSKLERPAHDQ